MSDISQAFNHFTPADIFWKSLFVGCVSHSMEMVKSAVEQINLSHVPVIALDQLLLSLAKQIQWTLHKCMMKISMSSCLVDSILKWQPSKCLVSSWALVADQSLCNARVHYTGHGWFILWGKSSNSIMAGTSSDCSQFLYCVGVLDSQLCCLQLVPRALREAHFTVYVQAIKQILPWFMDHSN